MEGYNNSDRFFCFLVELSCCVFYRSGRSPAALSLKLIQQKKFDLNNPLPRDHGLTVTVPGAAAAWCDTVEKFGSNEVEMSYEL